MKKITLIIGMLVSLNTIMFSEGYKTGDNASDFKLKNVDGKFVSLADFPNAKGFVVIFTCNHCPFAKAYQDRIIEIDRKYKQLGYPVVAINSNDPGLSPEDSYDQMIVRAKEKGFTFPYLFDETQTVYRTYGATRTPHVFLLQKQGKNLVVKYIGAIDDNYEDATKVSQPYLANALNSVIAGKSPDPSYTKAIGCSIKDKTASN